MSGAASTVSVSSRARMSPSIGLASLRWAIQAETSPTTWLVPVA